MQRGKIDVVVCRIRTPRRTAWVSNNRAPCEASRQFGSARSSDAGRVGPSTRRPARGHARSATAVRSVRSGPARAGAGTACVAPARDALGASRAARRAALERPAQARATGNQRWPMTAFTARPAPLHRNAPRLGTEDPCPDARLAQRDARTARCRPEFEFGHGRYGARSNEPSPGDEAIIMAAEFRSSIQQVGARYPVAGHARVSFFDSGGSRPGAFATGTARGARRRRASTVGRRLRLERRDGRLQIEEHLRVAEPRPKG